MAFQLIDLENWERREFYEHFIKEVVCTYSVVVNIDITNLKGQKLYPAMIWLLTKTVNDMPEFRTSLTPEGLGIYVISAKLCREIFSIPDGMHCWIVCTVHWRLFCLFPVLLWVKAKTVISSLKEITVI